MVQKTRFWRIARTLLALTVLALGILPPHSGMAQWEGEGHLFEETGYYVGGRFWQYFNEYGGLEIFGYPITTVFEYQGVQVQFFQNARMEWHGDHPEPYKVQLGLLADELKYRRPPVPEPMPRSRRRVYFPETGHSVAYAFLDYFREKGGIDLFGYPVTEMYFEDGKIVQYFQRLKMEWHPEDRTSPIHIGNLGELYVSIYQSQMPAHAFQRAGEGGYNRPNTSPTLQPTVSSIRAVVSLKYSVMSRQSEQVVSVLVTDGQGNPVPKAQVTVRLETPDGTVLPNSVHTVLTDGRGLARIEDIPITEGQTGSQIIVHAEVTYNNLTTYAQNVFLLWW